MATPLLRIVPFLLAGSLAATGCINDATGSGPADLSQEATVSTDGAGVTPTGTGEREDELASSTTSVVESLAFGDEEPAPGTQQLWTGVRSVSLEWTIEFESDPSLEIVAGFTAGQGLTARWTDDVEGDVLSMVRDGTWYRAYRVGNEAFLAQEEPGEAGFFVKMLTEVVAPLESGVLPPEASTFASVDGVSSPVPDVLYELVEGESEGTVSIVGLSTIDVVRTDAEFVIPEVAVMLTREQVENFSNALLREWYFDQAS